MKFEKTYSGEYTDGRFTITKKTGIPSTWWLIEDNFDKLPKSMTSADTLAEAKNLIKEFKLGEVKVLSEGVNCTPDGEAGVEFKVLSWIDKSDATDEDLIEISGLEAYHTHQMGEVHRSEPTISRTKSLIVVEQFWQANC